MKIVIASDHAGFDLKLSLLKSLKARGYSLRDLGTHSRRRVDYPDYALRLGEALREKQGERGILICGSGVGVTVAANKIHGIRAGMCHDEYSAHQGVEHDDMNVLILGAWVVGEKLAEDLAVAFLRARFQKKARYIRRLKKVVQLENRRWK